MRFIKDVFLGWFKGLIHFDPVILVSSVVLVALIGFPDMSNPVLKLALNPSSTLESASDSMLKLPQGSALRSALNPIIKYQEEKQKSEIQRKLALLLQEAKGIPSSSYQANLNVYQKLSKLQPDNQQYQSKVNLYEQKAKRERLRQIAKEKTARAQRIKAERLAKKKAARVAAQRAKRAKALKEKRRLALIAAAKARVEKTTSALKNSKWKGDVIYHKNGKRYLIGSSIAMKFDKKLVCKFIVSKSMVDTTQQGNNTMYKLNTGAVMSNIFGNNSSKNIVKVSSDAEVVIDVKGIDDQGGWTPNGRWSGQLHGKVLQFSLSPFSVVLKKTY